MQRRIALLTRVTTLAGETLHFTMPASGRRRSRVDFIDKEHVPAFDGDQAWFEVEKVSAKPWPYWRAVRRVEGPVAALGLAGARLHRGRCLRPTSSQSP